MFCNFSCDWQHLTKITTIWIFFFYRISGYKVFRRAGIRDISYTIPTICSYTYSIAISIEILTNFNASEKVSKYFYQILVKFRQILLLASFRVTLDSRRHPSCLLLDFRWKSFYEIFISYIFENIDVLCF